MVTVLSVGTELEGGAEHGLRMSEFCYNHDNGEICDWRFWVGVFGVSLVLLGLIRCCQKTKKEREERGASWERSHPSTPSSSSPSSHPFGSNTLFAPTMPTTSYDWGLTEENSEQCFRIQLPPAYEAPPPYTSVELGGEQRKPLQGIMAAAPQSPPSYNSVVDQQRF